MPFPFQSLPLELRRLVYARLFPNRAEKTRLSPHGTLAIRTNCDVPTALLLVGKNFSRELLAVLANVREVQLEGGPRHDATDQLLASWSSLLVEGTKRLSLHMQDVDDQKYNMHWEGRKTRPADVEMAERINRLVSASAKSALRDFTITIDLRNADVTQRFLNVLYERNDGLFAEDASMTVYADKWLGLSCRQLRSSLERIDGQRLRVEITARSPLQ